MEKRKLEKRKLKHILKQNRNKNEKNNNNEEEEFTSTDSLQQDYFETNKSKLFFFLTNTI